MPWFLKFFLNPRVLIVLAIAIAAGVIYWKFQSLQSDLEEERAALKQEKDNNAVLRGNIDTLTDINVANDRILKQQVKAAATTVETINKLSNDLKASSKSFGTVQTKIDSIKDAPAPLTLYLKEAISGIQIEREIVNPSTPASAPKDQK